MIKRPGHTGLVFAMVALMTTASWLAPAALAGRGSRVSARALVGGQAPDFDLPSLQGQLSGRLVDHRGKVVVIEFWATHCGWCRRTHPSLARAQKAHPGQLVVLAISAQGRGKLQRYLNKHRLGVTVLHDRRARVSRQYEARATPTLVVVDRMGRVRYAGVGAPAAPKALLVAGELMGSG